MGSLEEHFMMPFFMQAQGLLSVAPQQQLFLFNSAISTSTFF